MFGGPCPQEDLFAIVFPHLHGKVVQLGVSVTLYTVIEAISFLHQGNALGILPIHIPDFWAFSTSSSVFIEANCLSFFLHSEDRRNGREGDFRKKMFSFTAWAEPTCSGISHM